MAVRVSKSTKGDGRADKLTSPFMDTMRKRFKTAWNASSKTRGEMLTDKKFSALDQWPDDIRKQRELDRRPCLTIDRINPAIRQVTNTIRQSRPGIQINPVDSGSDPAVAEVLQGVIRNIESNSDADVAYFTGATDQATCGLGWWRVDLEYLPGLTWEQELRINRIRNTFSVVMDPAANKFDRSDMRYCFVIYDLPKDEVKERYGQDVITTLDTFMGVGGIISASDWAPEGKTRVAEYWYKEKEKETLALVEVTTVGLGGVTTTTRNVLPKAAAQENENVRIVDTREVTYEKVKWALVTGAQILDGNDEKTEGRDWVGLDIPLVPVIGDEIDIEGNVDFRGLVRPSRDPQRMKNYWASAQTEAIALAPRVPYIGAAGQFEGFENMWKEANVRNFPYLEYNPISLAGQLLGAPQRQHFEPAIQAINMAMAQSEYDIEAATGFYKPSLGAPGNETSGAAIVARQQQGTLGASNYPDNLARSIKRTGKILLDLIPKVYGAPRIERILGKNDVPKTIGYYSKSAIGDQQVDLASLQQQYNIEKIYDLSVGRYDVTVSVGPSKETRRQEAVEAMSSVFQAQPELIQLFGDMWFKNMDWPGAREMADRAKLILKSTHPELLPPEDGQEPIPPQVQRQLQQAQQIVQQLQQQNAELQRKLDSRMIESSAQLQMTQMEIQSRETLAKMQAQIDLIKTQLQISADKAQGQLDAEMQVLDMKSRERQAAARKPAQPKGER